MNIDLQFQQMECFIKTFVTSSPVPFLRIEYVSLFTQTNFSLRYCLYFIPLSIFHQLKFNLIRRYKMFRLNFNPNCLPSIFKGNIKFFNPFSVSFQFSISQNTKKLLSNSNFTPIFFTLKNTYSSLS